MMQKKQRGLTMISWVIIISLAAVQAVAALRIVPVYLSYSSVKKIMDEIAVDPGARGATPKQLSGMLVKRLNINGIYDLEQNTDAFSYQKTKDGMDISLHYEARGPIYGNLEFVATFEYKVEIPNQ